MPKVRKRNRISFITSVLLHLGGLILLVLSDHPKEKGAITVLSVELSGHDLTAKYSRPTKRKALPTLNQLGVDLNAKPEAESNLNTENVASMDDGHDHPGAGTPSERAAYLLEILKRIDQTKRYPRQSILREEEGRVLLSFDVAVDGKVLNAKIEQPSPYDSLNQSALEIIQRLDRLPPPPDTHDGVAHFHIPILYQLNRI